MSTPIAVHTPPGPRPAGGAGGGLSSLGHNPAVLLAAAGGGLVLLLVLARRAPADSTGTDQTSAYDSTSSDLYNSIQPEIDALAAALSRIQDAQSTPGRPITTPITTLPAQLTGVTPLRPAAPRAGWAGQ